MFFDTLPSLLGFAMYIHHLCSSSTLEFYIFVFSFASLLFFFLQEYLLRKRQKQLAIFAVQ